MTATQIRNLSLDDVRTKFGLVETGETDFFPERQGMLPEVDGMAREVLAEVEADYGYLSRKVMDEGAVKLLVEAKRNAFSLEPAIPQALAYMTGAPGSEYPTFGLVTNGQNFLFLKLMGNAYGMSKEFSIRNAGDLMAVLQVMRQLAAVVKGWGIER